MNSILSLSSSQLTRAAGIKKKIEKLNAELNSIIGSPGAVKTGKAKRGMSVAGRARVAAAQKARWAKIRAAKAKK